MREEALLATQVTTRSPMGAIIFDSAGIFIDQGWLRILGSGGHSRFKRSLPDWNRGRSNGFLFVADDVLGGFFALNGGAFGPDQGMLYYLAPDTLKWEPCRMGYSQFVVWALGPALDKFYEKYRWAGWEDEVQRISGDQALSIYPFLLTEGPSIGERSRRPVPVEEIYSLLHASKD